MLMPPPPCRASMQGPRHRQGEWRDRRVELRAVVADHAVAAFHGADRGGQYRARGIGELFARFDPRLFADHAVAADLLDIAVGIGDPPVPGEQLRRQAAAVADADRVGEHVADRKSTRLTYST